MAWQLARELERRERRYLSADLHAELALLARRATGTSVNLAKYLDRRKHNGAVATLEPLNL